MDRTDSARPAPASSQANPGAHGLHAHPGLTKREYFAAMAMNGLAGQDRVTPLGAAELAVKYADALIEQLERE